MACNSPVVQPLFESCFTNDGPRQVARTSRTQGLLPDDSWHDHHTRAVQWRRPWRHPGPQSPPPHHFGTVESSMDGPVDPAKAAEMCQLSEP